MQFQTNVSWSESSFRIIFIYKKRISGNVPRNYHYAKFFNSNDKILQKAALSARIQMKYLEPH